MADSLVGREIAEPTEIQVLTIPPGLAGRDVCGKAPTGSGKTIAFGLILAERLRDHAQGRPSGLVLVPTRELAQQVQRELHLLDVNRKFFTTSVFGGTGYGPQVQRLRRSAIVVATPGRLEDLLSRRDIDLRDVRVCVLDEADRMADMGFLPSVRRILDRLPRKRQMLLFSATLDGAVGSIVDNYLSEPLHLATSGVEAEPDIEHVFEVLLRGDRATRVAELLSEHGNLIAFCRTKHGSDRFARQLESLGVRCAVIHGNRSQAQRQQALQDFRNGAADVLVATDVAARGIHIDDVPCVVQCDPPDDPKDYVHRAGRTGRAGARGIVVSFVEPSQKRAVQRDMRSIGVPVDWKEAAHSTKQLSAHQASKDDRSRAKVSDVAAPRKRPGDIGWL
ncbi:MAG: hypothetical protein RL072_1021 [Actinomycetota bacterium]